MQQDLYSRHLMEKRPSYSEESGSLSIHPHIKDYISPILLNYPARYNQVLARATHLIRGVFPRQDASSIPVDNKLISHEKYYPHILILHAAYKKGVKKGLPMDPPIEFGQLLSDLAHYMYEADLKKDIFDIFDTAEHAFNKILGPDSFDLERLQLLSLRASIELDHDITKRAQSVKLKEEIVQFRLTLHTQV